MYICQYCSRECKNANSLRNHERLCKENPNRQESSFKLYNEKVKNGEIEKCCNQFEKAKQNGIEYVISDKTREKLQNVWKNKHHSEETKNKISNSYKKYLEAHPEKIGWVMNHSSHKSYPEKYFEDLFKNENINLKYHKYVGPYELDFYNDELKKYIEIDGKQHFTKYMIEHDKIRNEYLKNLGWKGFRIRWSLFKSMSDEEKRIIIDFIKDFIS